VLGSYAAGISSDLLTATLLATEAPVVVCPAMHTEMWRHPAVRENVATLRRRGVHVVEPESGRLAGGDVGEGRLAAPETIVAAVERILATARDLAGLHVLVTAGGTREPIDPVRFVGNRSSGKQGHAIADEAAARGAKVTLVTTVGLAPPPGADVVRVETAAEMADAVGAVAPGADVVIMAAAVADFRPKDEEGGKIERADRETLTLELVRTVDVLASTARPGLFRVGFAAEAGPRLDRARAKKAAKGVDLLVFNDILAEGVGIGSDENEITILTPSREVHIPRTSKAACAAAIADHIEEGLAR
jgi:phosphopantothenoylcysteine decarboxylase/phosphopantothenate--cysteine ligase